MYRFYQAFANTTDPARRLSTHASQLLNVWGSGPTVAPLRRMAALLEQIELAGFSHDRPDYGLDHVASSGSLWPVAQSVELDLPFGDLLAFRRAGLSHPPKVLLLAPMSGHFATLLRGTVRTMLQDFDVFISDWKNPRDIPLAAGRFDLDDFIDYIIAFLRHLGPDTHVVAVCQPCVPALAAAALLAQDRDPVQPASLTLMAGPIDTRISPTAVNRLAMEHPLSWFEERMVSKVPFGLAGAGRRVYPGFLQLAAFVSMNFERHAKSFADLLRLRLQGEAQKANAIREFYMEYFAVMDLPGEFYLQTVGDVFQKMLLAQGQFHHRGRLVEPRAIKRTFLMTVEGERDDICAIGQTMAAHDLCSGLRPFMKSHHMETGVGHYGVFNGRRWERRIYPRVREMIQTSL